MSGTISSTLHLGAAAMNVHARAQAVSAHNIANISTNGYIPHRARFSLDPSVPAVLRQEDPPVAGAVFDVTSRVARDIRPSGTDLATEIPRMISNQHAYKANAQVVRTADAMLGVLLDTRA